MLIQARTVPYTPSAARKIGYNVKLPYDHCRGSAPQSRQKAELTKKIIYNYI